MSVDLPLPFGPSRPSRVPGPRTRFTSSSTRRSPKRLATCSATTSRLVRRSVALKSIAAVRRSCRLCTLGQLVDQPPRLAGCAPATWWCAPSARGAASRARAGRDWRASPASAPARAARRPSARGTRCSARASRRSRRRAPGSRSSMRSRDVLEEPAIVADDEERGRLRREQLARARGCRRGRGGWWARP